MITYFMADPHLSRDGENVLGRPFSSPLEMSRSIVNAVNSRVSRQDRLIIAGDFSFREPAYWRTQFRCRNMTLVLGNHDPRAKCIAAFGRMNVRETYDTKCKEHPCFVSHYPHAYWPKSHYGSFHLYGHVHDQRTDTIASVFPEIRSLDIGVDSAKRLLGEYTCFREDEIYDSLIQRLGHDPVEWYEARNGRYRKDHGEPTGAH